MASCDSVLASPYQLSLIRGGFLAYSHCACLSLLFPNGNFRRYNYASTILSPSTSRGGLPSNLASSNKIALDTSFHHRVSSAPRPRIPYMTPHTTHRRAYLILLRRSYFYRLQISSSILLFSYTLVRTARLPVIAALENMLQLRDGSRVVI
ncbi:hypothetical protein BDN70DRAFT_888204 [Pholiota conissans]|uniref:Uncharacterized protein n=1 Tax=Pholiota conissans TaxID=109636 RepID=A0A9P6CRR9_9AGAR|nr:hypothetical protein BDN70DRAFT_888204 [Pholiota conissans]